MNRSFSLLQTFKSALLVIIASTFLIADVQSQSRVPQFKDYPVTEPYIGKAAPVALTRDDRMFHTRLREASKKSRISRDVTFSRLGVAARVALLER